MFRLNDEKLKTDIGHSYRSFDTGDYKSPEIFTGSHEESSKM